MPGRNRCIVDASVLLDFITGDILEILFSLPFDFSTSDIVADEVVRSFSHDELRTLGLDITELEEEEVLEIAALQAENLVLSPKDLSIFLIARNSNALLISGDGPLRELAREKRIEYHGTLWLLEELVKRDILPSRDAAAALRAMLDNKRWLPRSESAKMIRRWEQEE